MFGRKPPEHISLSEKHISKINKIKNPIEVASGSAGGFAGGYILSGGDLQAGFDGAKNGAFYGGLIGAGTGLGTGYAQAKINGVNPWTGKSSRVGSTGVVGHREIEAQGYKKPNKAYNRKYGRRYLDGVDGKSGAEAKVERLPASRFAKLQMLKDITLLQEGKFNSINWKFYRSPITGRIGPTPGFLNYAQRTATHLNVNYKYSPDSYSIKLWLDR